MVIGVTPDAVGAALERHVHRGARGVPLLRIERGRLDLELLHRPGRRHERDAAAIGHVGRAIERELVAPRAAVRGEVRRAAVVEGTRELQVAVVRDPGCEPGEDERIAIRERHQRDLPLANHLAGRSGSRFEQRGVGGNRHGFLETANLEAQPELQPIADADFDALAGGFLETGELRRDLVGAGGEIRRTRSRHHCRSLRWRKRWWRR